MNSVSIINVQHMIARGAKHLISYEKDLNDINVFPVPDGDTGSNLAFLMNMILLKQPQQTNSPIDQLKLACLQGSRGNSGMIFSQFIIAMCDFVSEKKQLNREQFVDMCEFSVNKTIQAVHKPMEGTILTVMKDWVNSLKQYLQKTDSIPDLLSHALHDALHSTEQTKWLREEFRKQNVVDAGAKGFCYFLYGFIEGLTTKHEQHIEETASAKQEIIAFDTLSMHDNSKHESFNHDNLIENLTHRYCTEFIVTHVKDEQRLKNKLAGYGDSLVFIGSQSYCKLHIHSDKPNEIAQLLQAEGQILFQKVEDMQRQQEMLLKPKTKIAIVVDSACDLPQQFLDEHQIHLLPLSIIVNGSQYLDKQTITAEQLYTLMSKEKAIVNSSLPSREQIVRLYNQLLANYDQVFSIHVSSALSGTFAACQHIAEELNSDKLHVIDSKSLSGAYGLIIKQFAQYIDAKAFKQHEIDVYHLKQILERLISASQIYVTVPTLTSMVNSGRLSKTAGKIASLLSLKPIVTLDHNGKAKLINKAVFKKTNIPQLIKQVSDIHKKTPISDYALLYTDDQTELYRIEQSLVGLIGKAPSYTTTVSSIIGKYAGSGAYSVAIISDKERML